MNIFGKLPRNWKRARFEILEMIYFMGISDEIMMLPVFGFWIRRYFVFHEKENETNIQVILMGQIQLIGNLLMMIVLESQS